VDKIATTLCPEEWCEELIDVVTTRDGVAFPKRGVGHPRFE